MDAFNSMIDTISRLRAKESTQAKPLNRTWEIHRTKSIAAVKFDDGGYAPVRGLLTATVGENRYIGYVGKYLAVVSFSVYGPYIAYKGESYLLRDLGGWMYEAY